MYVCKRIGAIELVRQNWQIELLVLVVVAFATFVQIEFLSDWVQPPVAVVGVLGTAISFFIGFINAQAYDRWWEARKIWGAFVNDSRSFARMVTTLFLPAGDPTEAREIQRRLVYRHIAYLYAVKEKLRGETSRDYDRFLDQADLARIRSRVHVPQTLLTLQGRDLVAAEQAGYLEVIRLARFDHILESLSNSMGMAERTKLTPFPTYYASLVRVSIWVFLLVFPTSLTSVVGYWAIAYAFVLGTILRLAFRAGQTLMDPFEGTPAGTPMSAIVRTIEINLLEQLGEKDLPEPVAPINGRYVL